MSSPSDVSSNQLRTLFIKRQLLERWNFLLPGQKRGKILCFKNYFAWLTKLQYIQANCFFFLHFKVWLIDWINFIAKILNIKLEIIYKVQFEMKCLKILIIISSITLTLGRCPPSIQHAQFIKCANDLDCFRGICCRDAVGTLSCFENWMNE